MQIGKVSEITYNRSVLKKITHPVEGVLPGAETTTVMLEEVTAVMSSNCILKWFEGCEDYFLQKNINALYEKAAIPRYVQLEINIPEQFDERNLGKIIRKLNDSVTNRNLSLCQCRVYQGQVTHPVAHITVMGETKYHFSRKNIVPDMDVVMAGSIAIGGTAVLSDLYKEKLSEKYASDFVLNCIELKRFLDISEIVRIVMEENKPAAIYSISDGVFGAAWELASFAGMGIELHISKIPVWQETIEIAELFDYNPYQMDGTGAVLFVTENGESLVQNLEEHGIYADVIGTMKEGKDRVALKGLEKRYLEPPRGNELYRFI